MWEKIKAFFENKVTKIVCWVVLALDCVGLIIGGAVAEDINTAVVLTSGIVAAVAALVAFISSMIHKE